MNDLKERWFLRRYPSTLYEDNYANRTEEDITHQL
jgi:hypothetical protein